MAREPSWTARLLALTGLSAFAIAQPLTAKLAVGPQFFVAHDATALDGWLFVATLYLGVPSALWAVARATSALHRPSGRVVAEAFAALLVLVFAVPSLRWATGAPGPVAIALGVAAAAAFVWASRRASVAAFLPWLAAFTPVSAASFAFGSAASEHLFPPPAETRATTDGPALGTIAVLVLDEFPLSALLDENLAIDAARFPNFGRLAATSTWFRNASAVTTHTELAVPAILTGRYPSADRETASYETHPHNLFTLLHGRYRMNVHERITRLCPDAVCRNAETPAFAQRFPVLLADAGAILLVTVAPRDLGLGLPKIDEDWAGFWTEGGHGEKRNERGAFRLDRMERTLAAIDDTPGPMLYFAHHIVPHMPYEFFPSGRRYRPANPLRGYVEEAWIDDEWARVQPYQQFLVQLQFVDAQLGKFLDRLEAVGRFDDALLVVTADHGASFQPGQHRRGNMGMPHYYDDVLSIPLFIKRPGQRSAAVDNRNVESIDLMPTIADLAGATLQRPVEGAAIFAPAFEPRPQKHMVMGRKNNNEYTPNPDIPFQSFDFQVPTDPPRATVDWKIQFFGTGASRPNGLYAFGPFSERVGQPAPPSAEAAPCTGTFAEPFGTEWKQGRYRIKPTTRLLPAHLIGAVACDAPPSAIAAAVNGTIVTTTRTYPTERPNRAGFEILLPETSFRDGENTLALFALHADGGLQSIRIGQE